MNISKSKQTIFKAILVLLAILISIVAVSSESSSEDTLYCIGNDFKLPQQGMGIVVITHGWIEKGKDHWPQQMAEAIHSNVDPNQWLCGYFDWEEGAKTLNATNAAKYARDSASHKLAEQLLNLNTDLEHIHLIGHSSGCWLVSEAAKELTEKTKADIHLTFLDAYLPVFWDEDSLADVNTPANVDFWTDHYYTRDFTLKWTHCDLTNAHNVDITDIDQWIQDHNFPWQWYYATIAGEYPPNSFCDDDEIITYTGDLQYGFTRSRESGGKTGWEKSLTLPKGNKAVELKKP